MAPQDDLIKVAEASLPEFGLEDSTVTLLQSFVNAAFVVERGHEKWFLKIYCPTRHKRNYVESELLWLQALTMSGEVNAPCPRKTTDGRLVWIAPGSTSPRSCCISVTEWVTGETVPNNERRAVHFRAIGKQLGRLHGFTAKWRPRQELHRPLLTSAGIYGVQGIEGGNVEIALQGLSSDVTRDLGYAEELMKKAELRVGRDPERFGLIHGDPSFGNIRFNSEHATLLDFDDCGYGHFVFDLAVVLAGAWGDQDHYDGNRDALLSGYQDVRPISPEEVSSIPAFMGARAASLLFWAAAQSPRHSWIDGQHQRLREYLGMQ
jgi:Ser/Thr protein kinase RdoA (MazF antagonist)